MNTRLALAATTLAAALGAAQPAAADTPYCGNRLQTTGVTFTFRPGGGYGVMFLDYAMPLRNMTNGSITANVAVRNGGISGFTPAANSATTLTARGSATVRIGTFTGAPGGPTAPSVETVLAQVGVRC